MTYPLINFSLYYTFHFLSYRFHTYVMIALFGKLTAHCVHSIIS
jgi:hypothetical protein